MTHTLSVKAAESIPPSFETPDKRERVAEVESDREPRSESRPQATRRPCRLAASGERMVSVRPGERPIADGVSGPVRE